MNFESETKRDFLQENLTAVLAIALMLLLILSLFIFAIRTVLPNWQARAELAAQVAALQNQQEQGTGALNRDIVAAQAQFDQTANQFLSEAQAATFLHSLYDYAEAADVSVVELQAEPPAPAENGQNLPYDMRQFRLLVAGELPQLNAYLGSLQETAVPGIHLQNLTITANQLSVDLLLYTSPVATGETIVLPPVAPTLTPAVPQATAVPPQPTATPPPDVSGLIEQLDAPWVAEDWPQVITLIQQIRQQAPSTPEMIEKLYAARVNYGYQLAGLGETAVAAEQFEQALALFPDGEEAEAGLQTLFTPTATATPTAIIHIVIHGDTLYSIGRRYGTTVDALKAANGLSNNNITPGQQLTIP